VDAAYRLGYLLNQSRIAGMSGLAIKDTSNRARTIPESSPNQIGNTGE
jgi:hypothetical protein